MRLVAKVQIRNADMIQARLDRGLSQKALSEIVGCSIQYIGLIEKMDFTGFTKGHWMNIAEKICFELELPIEKVIPQAAIGRNLNMDKKVFRDVEAGQLIEAKERMEERLLLESPAEIAAENIDNEEMKEKLNDSLDKLDKREAEIIRLYYGIDRERHTLEKIGRIFKIQRERVRQVMFRGIRKLQHPKRSDSLMGYAASEEYIKDRKLNKDWRELRQEHHEDYQ